MSWLVDPLPDAVHVVPVGDLTTHSETNCPCGPRIELFRNVDGRDDWMVTHHSLDGREKDE